MDGIPREWTPPARILLGPGPSDVSPRVRRAMAAPLLGHLDPDFLHILDEVNEGLRRVFRTRNALTFPVSGTGSAGMECMLVNLVEPGDRVLIGVAGAFGERLAAMASRMGAEVVREEVPWGETIPPERFAAAIRRLRPRVAAIVHAETSTGAWQPLDGLADACREAGSLLVVDCVTSLGGAPVEVDAWGIDAAYAGTQKCLSAPPGLAPVTFGERAVARLDTRQRPVASWYLDVSLIRRYLGGERLYHHTAPISMIYALREALREVCEEGLEVRWARHERHHRALLAGLAVLGLEPEIGEPALWMLHPIRVPAGVDETAVRRDLLERSGIEIGGGLGAFRGKVWRIGLMGTSCHEENVVALLEGLAGALARAGHPPRGSAADAAAAARDRLRT